MPASPKTTRRKSRGSGDSVSSLAAIVNHPLRAKIWFVLVEQVASPAQLSQMLGESLNSCAYHVNVLEKAGLLELVEEIPRRGAIEHRWRGIVRPAFDSDVQADWTVEEKLAAAMATLQIAFADHARAYEARTLVNRDDFWVARLGGRVDDEGFAEVSAGYYRLLDTFYEAEAKTKERVRAGKSTRTMPVSGLASFFETPDRVSD
jgi:hypothetical protein